MAACTIARIPKLGHELVPALRNVSVVDTDLGWARRESVPGQGGYDDIEILKDRQHVHVIKKTAGQPCVRISGTPRPDAARRYTKWMPRQMK